MGRRRKWRRQTKATSEPTTTNGRAVGRGKELDGWHVSDSTREGGGEREARRLEKGDTISEDGHSHTTHTKMGAEEEGKAA